MVGGKRHFTSTRVLLFIAAAVLASCGGDLKQSDACGRKPDEPNRSDLSPLVFTSRGQEFDALIHTPAPSDRNGSGVVLIGGGFGNDLDWTTPGTITTDGPPLQVTINGRAHADAPAISHALVQHGFTVLRWSTIARGDPLAEHWPARATPRSLEELTDQARAAIASLRLSGIAPNKIILVGHSLGAARACTIAAEEPGVRALVLLSPAYFTKPERIPPSFADAGMRFGEDVLRQREIPCLAIFGTADTSKAVNAPSAQRLAGTRGFERFEVWVLDGLGHQLGPQEGALLGPISADAVDALARWARDVTHSP